LIADKVWERFCNAPWGDQCEHRLISISKSVGLTEHPNCGQALTVECDRRVSLRLRVLTRLAGQPVVAGCMIQSLIDAPQRRLYRLLPNITHFDFNVIVSFARDYTARRIPWAVIVNGDCLELYKLLPR
jgi:hypothetical protein